MSVSSRRYLSLWLRRLSTDRIARRTPAYADAPLVVVAAIKSAQRITALNDAAARLRLKPDMPLADARAMYPALPVEVADPHADRRLLAAIADWCDRYTPLVGLDPPDGLLLDVTSCAHLFGGEAALCHDLIARLVRQGFHARVAIADSVGCAWGVARYGEQGIVPPGKTEAVALPLPIAALRVEPEIVAELATAGLKRVADLATRPRAPFAARFGEELVRRLDQMLGRVDEPITPRLPLPVAIAEQRLAEPIAREADVLRTIEYMALKLARVLERRGEGMRRIGLALFRADGKAYRLELGTGAPLRDPSRVRKLFVERLVALGDACDPGFGYDMIRLSALATERSDPAQTGLAVRCEDDTQAEELTHLIDRLSARFGPRRISRFVPQDTHIPEYAMAAVPAHAMQTPAVAQAIEQDSLGAPRPIRLFERPYPVEVIDEVPDSPPVRFRWRQVWHDVVLFEGPERIAVEWWRDDRGKKLERDYFRVESNQGVRIWLFRQGLYEAGQPKPRWYVHGLFA
jgi:protein ImuB